MSSNDATCAVHELVLAIQEALQCGARATETDATGALTEMYNRSEHAGQCIGRIKEALIASLSSVADTAHPPMDEQGLISLPDACPGSTELEERRDRLREEAFSKNKQLKAVIDHLRSVLSAVDGWNADAAAK